MQLYIIETILFKSHTVVVEYVLQSDVYFVEHFFLLSSQTIDPKRTK